MRKTFTDGAKSSWITSAFGLMFCAGATLAAGVMMMSDPEITAWKSIGVMACSPMIVVASVSYYRMGLKFGELNKQQ